MLQYFPMARLDPGDARPATFLQLGRLGDAVVAVSFLQAVRRACPALRMRLVQSASCRGLDDSMLPGLFEPGHPNESWR